MGVTIIDGETCMEKLAIVMRHQMLNLSTYSRDDEYREENAISPHGKGTGLDYMSNTWQPASEPFQVENGEVVHNSIKKYTVVTEETDNSTIGGWYDIYGRNQEGGRNRLLELSKYNKDNQYSKNLFEN